MTKQQFLRLEAVEEDLREQAQGEQCGVLLEFANRLKAVLVEISREQIDPIATEAVLASRS